jgi:hypothetical protein
MSNPFLPTLTHKEMTVVGQDSTYDFGVDANSTPIQVKVTLDFISRKDYHSMQRWLSPLQGLGNFYFEESKYKYWENVKITSSDTVFSRYAFLDDNTDVEVFTGDIPLEFKAFSPFAKGFYLTIEEGNDDGMTGAWYEGTGLLSEDFTPYYNSSDNEVELTGITGTKFMNVYNGGTVFATPIVKLSGYATSIQITNETNNSYIIINSLSASKDIYVDCELGQVYSMNGDIKTLETGIHGGGFITLDGSCCTEEYNATFTNGDATVTLTSGAWESDIVGRQLCISPTNVVTVLTRTSDTEIELEAVYSGVTGTYDCVSMDTNVIEIDGENMNFDITWDYQFKYL